MNGMTAEQRGDLAEAMLPVAANLTVLVHGEGGPEDVRDVLAGLTDTEKNALIVVLAGLVDPEQSVGKALGWLDHNEHGVLTVPSWSEGRSVRELAPEAVEDLDEDFVDPVAVQKFMKGFRVEVTDAEFLESVRQLVAMEMALSDVDQLRGWRRRTAENWVNRLRKQYQRSGRVFPSLAQPSLRVLEEEEVITIRERGAAGVTDLAIAMSFGVSQKTVGEICRGRRYAQFGGPIREVRVDEGVQASREFMCGHADNSRSGTRRHVLGDAA